MEASVVRELGFGAVGMAVAVVADAGTMDGMPALMFGTRVHRVGKIAGTMFGIKVGT